MKRLSSTPSGRFLVYLSYLIMLAFVTACSVTPQISSYDEGTDQGLTTIQKKTDIFIASLKRNFGTDAASLKSSKRFYDDIDQDLLRLETRVKGAPENVKTENLVHNIRLAILGDGTDADVTSMKHLHGLPENVKKGIPLMTLEINQKNINQVISAAKSLEVEKARR
ncbi:MAG: hypothetical protein FDX21_07880 [Chlorobium sp.]|nr:MAG: hypothetical protein FDX21_07880 [Chlorobium sp.]